LDGRTADDQLERDGRDVLGSQRSAVLEWLPNPLVVPVGLAIGVLIAAPVGPVNIICIQRAIERGPLGGLLAGIGAVLADGLIASAAALGVSSITGLVSTYRDTIQVVGGLALIVFAISMLRNRPSLAVSASAQPSEGNLRAIVWDLPKAFLLTITNPAAVLGLVAIFGGISSFVAIRGTVDALTMVAAIMIGSLAWWTGLSMVVGRARHALKPVWLTRVNIAAGLLLLAFAAVLLGEVAYKLLAGRDF